MEGCSRQALMLESGEVVSQDLDGARALYARTCQAGFPGDCYRLARILERGDDSDARTEFKLYRKACEGDVFQGCYEVARAWEAARDPVKALPYYKKACDGGLKASCTKVRRLQQ
jgi:hypothetical protein